MNTRQQSLGERLLAARESLGLSRRRAAHKARVSEARWRQIENGVQYRDGVAHPATTTPETLVRMARAVDLDPADLLRQAGMPLDHLDRILDELDREESASEQHTQTLPPAGRGKMLDLTRFSPRDQELIEAFIFGLEAGRKRA